jgi:myo-inositol-1-phosphate synthase
MTEKRVGIWVFGVNGYLGACLLAANIISNHEEDIVESCLSSSHYFSNLSLTKFSSFVIGGVDIHGSTEITKIGELMSNGIIPKKYQDYLRYIDYTKYRVYSIDKDIQVNNLSVIEEIREMIRSFKDSQNLDRVICINLISTEENNSHHANLPLNWSQFQRSIAGDLQLNKSALYAIASFQEGCHYINFTPNQDIEISALQELASQSNIIYAGQDGKTGETLLKSALAPLFEIRKLQVLSWVGYNMLGNSDGENLSDPDKKITKISSKDKFLRTNLEHSANAFLKTEIDYVPSLGDRKVAIDFIHFRGFLDVEMSMQFTWMGCDTTLAVPVLIDIVRFANYFIDKGRTGYLDELGLFFKAGLGEEKNLVDQYNFLIQSLAK